MKKPRAVPIIILLNIIVYLLWHVLPHGENSFMSQNFLVSWTSLEQGRYWTLLTSEFSHNMFLHIFINMYVFMGFGLALERTLGRRRFVKFYLVAAIVASISYSVLSNVLLHEPDMPALGASGAISGVVVGFALMFPRARLLLFGLIPLPAIWAVVLAVGLDL